VVALCKRFAKGMVQRGWGRILNVSSIGAFQPTPTYAVYSASKAFVLSYSEAFSRELAGTGVTVTAVCPGITATEFLQVSGQQATLYQRLLMMDSLTVTRIGLRAMVAGRRSIVPGIANTLTAWSTRLMPRRAQTWMAHLVMKNAE
jgi:short-subunit dehydrogenase